jgi:hypothetical protein
MERQFLTPPAQLTATREIKRIAATSLAATLLCFSLAACVVEPARSEVVRVAPPPPPVEVVPAPRPGYVWDAGHWVWRQGRYVWDAGHWQAVRVGYHWVPGHWAERGGGWVWVEGHWAL